MTTAIQIYAAPAPPNGLVEVVRVPSAAERDAGVQATTVILEPRATHYVVVYDDASVSIREIPGKVIHTPAAPIPAATPVVDPAPAA